MRRAYLFAHWILTILLAPFILQGLNYILGKSPHQIVGLLEVYPITLLFSFIFSYPTFLVYIAIFNLLVRYKVNILVSKFCLIAIAVCGIYITQSLIEGSMSGEIIASFSITTVIVGLLLRLKKPDTFPQEKGFTI